MNEKFMDFFITLAPTLLTSVTAFLIGRYNNFQNRPLDKMELAYNRVYYVNAPYPVPFLSFEKLR